MVNPNKSNNKKNVSIFPHRPKMLPTAMETIQSSIPIKTVHNKVNLIESYENCFTRSYAISNINYQTSSEPEQDILLTKWRAFLNSLGSNEEMQLTIFNRNINMRAFQEDVLLKETGDGFDNLRLDMNEVLLGRITEGKNGLIKDEYITLSVHTDSLKKATEVFKRLDNDIDKHMKGMGSSAKPINIEDRVEILHDIYNLDNAGEFNIKTKILGPDGRTEEVASFDFDNIRAQGLAVSDVIAPSSIVIRKKDMEIGNQYVRALRISEFPAILGDNFLSDMTNMPFNMVTTLNIKPLSNQEADDLINQQLTFIREEKNNLQKANRKANVDENMISPQILEREAEVLELRSEIRENDEHLFEATLSCIIFAPTKELLSEYTDTVISECKKASVTCEILEDQQEEGFVSTLPLCVNVLKNPRTLKSSSCAIMVPFSNLEVKEKDGINYTMNAVSKNLIVYNRENKANYNGFILGSSGCVDCETEFFNGTEWKSIADYQEGEKVLQFNTETNEASLVIPNAYIKKPCDKMYQFKTFYGINQVLSAEHRFLYYNKSSHRPGEYSDAKFMSAGEVAALVKQNKFNGYVKTNFDYSGSGIELSNNEILLMLAVICDGHFSSKAINSARCDINLKKSRKKNELFRLLKESGKDFRVYETDDGYTHYSFEAPRREKTFLPYWYNCNKEQLQLICENILQWDGTVDDTGRKSFASSSKETVDFVQFAFTSCGYRAVISCNDRTGQEYQTNGKTYIRRSKEFRVFICEKTMCGLRQTGDNNVVTELVPKDGYKYCFNVPTSALVLRRNGRIFCTGNSGKSFTVKSELINVFLKKNADILILDPEQEYVYLTSKLNGQVIPIMPGGKYHINPLDISSLEYEFDESSAIMGEIVDPILEKVSFIMKLFETMLNKSWGMDSIQKTLIDECLRDLYKPFMKDGRLNRAPRPDETPTLNDMKDWFMKCPEPEAREIYFALRRYAGEGTLNIFSQTTNVELHNRIVCFDISAVGDELKLMAMNIIQDAMWSRLVENRRIGKFTYIYVDECHIFFQPGNEASAEFLTQLWKRARKYNGVPTGITQNTADMVDHPAAKKLLSECNFVQVLNQQSDESRLRLKETLNLSDSALDYITSAPVGQGLFYTGSNTVPFFSRFPKDNAIYPLLTSNAQEILEIKERERRERLKAQAEEKAKKYKPNK